jgi:REP element-mobilizing transposase RayT
MNGHSAYNPEIHHRRSIRLQGYDYSQNGMYFITICAFQREKLFGEIQANNGEAEMVLNEFGRLVQFTWQDLPNHNPGIELGPFVIMPNHIHAIVLFVGAGSEPALTEPALTEPALTEPAPGSKTTPVSPDTKPAHDTRPASDRADCDPTNSGAGCEPRAGCEPASTTPLSEIVRQLKTFSARRINQARNTPGLPVWQRNYWEHIIRSDESARKIADYISNNPQMWDNDQLFTDV